MKDNPMGKREKILVGLMILAIAWGAWEVFFSGRHENGEKNFQANNSDPAQTAADISQKTQDLAIGGHEKYILQLAASKWQRDPFYPLAGQKDYDKKNETSQNHNQTYYYTGFLEVGKKKMAIINGLEYQPGDEIEPGSAVLLNIFPEHVEIRITETGKTRIIYYQN
jgi:hypothetical protein